MAVKLEAEAEKSSQIVSLDPEQEVCGAAMVTVAVDALDVVDPFVQVRLKVVVTVKLPVETLVPLVALVPVQLALLGLALAVQDVELVELQVRALAEPLLTEVGLAESEAVGPAIVTVAVEAEDVVDPSVQVSEKVVV